jgi:hypothetical protein
VLFTISCGTEPCNYADSITPFRVLFTKVSHHGQNPLGSLCTAVRTSSVSPIKAHSEVTLWRRSLRWVCIREQKLRSLETIYSDYKASNPNTELTPTLT